MKQVVLKAILQMSGKVILLTVVVGLIIGIIGYTNKWDAAITYSNAFFIAGCLMIVAGASSRFVASQEWNTFQQLNAESFRNMSSGERVKFIINASSSVSLVILGLLSGILLILISVIVTEKF